MVAGGTRQRSRDSGRRPNNKTDQTDGRVGGERTDYELMLFKRMVAAARGTVSAAPPVVWR